MRFTTLYLTRLFTCCIGLSVLAGCGGDGGESMGNDIGNDIDVEPIPTSETPDTNPPINIPNSGGTRLTLALNDESFLVTTTERRIYTISANDGEVRNVYDGGFGTRKEFLGPVDVVDNVAYVSAIDNTLNAIDLESGNFLWEFTLGESSSGNVPSAPVCSSIRCYVVSESKELGAINLESQEAEWVISLDSEGLVRREAVSSRFPVVVDDLIHIGVDYDDDTFAFNTYSALDGSLQNTIALGSPVLGPPVIVDDKLIFVANRTLGALDRSTYQVFWESESNLVASDPVIVNNTAVVSIGDSENTYIPSLFGTAGLSTDTGEILWAIPNLEFQSFIRPESDGNLAIVLDPRRESINFLGNQLNGSPMGVDASTGAVVWDLESINGRANSAPLAVPGFLFFHDIFFDDLGGNIAAVDTLDGSVVWVGFGVGRSDIVNHASVVALVHNGEVFRPSRFPTISKR